MINDAWHCLVYPRPKNKPLDAPFPRSFFIEILEAEYNFNKVEKGAINNKRRAFFTIQPAVCAEGDTSLNKGKK